MKKALAILLVAALLTASLAGLALADDNNEATPAPTGSYYLSVTGTVTSVNESEDGLRVEISRPDADREGRAFLIVTDGTVFPFEEEIEEGDTVTAFYLANVPMILIYPPQYTAAVLVNGMPEDKNVNVDRFFSVEGEGGLYLSQGGSLAFRIGEDTEVVLADGTEFNFDYGSIDGRRIVVVYGPSTRSIPAEVTAIRLIVLFEDIAFGPLPIDPDMLPDDEDADEEAEDEAADEEEEYVPVTVLPFPLDDTIDASGWPIQVNGVNITAPAAFQTADGVLMVPLRAIAEALGYYVEWDSTLRSIRLGVAIHTWLGNTEVHVGRMAPQTISAAPALVEGLTFVPLDFFRVIGINNAFAFEGQIVIDNVNERME
ncbi:MAG: copper amine oxidase N-terminal domain-containing protein [Oscillospiraceae bacterium]|nr:copper amine oxidase N-terminal domain-containing protein [Oscillospiraceae bacterium]